MLPTRERLCLFQRLKEITWPHIGGEQEYFTAAGKIALGNTFNHNIEPCTPARHQSPLPGRHKDQHTGNDRALFYTVAFALCVYIDHWSSSALPHLYEVLQGYGMHVASITRELVVRHSTQPPSYSTLRSPCCKGFASGTRCGHHRRRRDPRNDRRGPCNRPCDLPPQRSSQGRCSCGCQPLQASESRRITWATSRH